MTEKNDLERLYAALATFEDDGSDSCLKMQVGLATENSGDLRSSWKRKTWEEFGGGVFQTPSGLYKLELNRDGTTKRLQRIGD